MIKNMLKGFGSLLLLLIGGIGFMLITVALFTSGYWVLSLAIGGVGIFSALVVLWISFESFFLANIRGNGDCHDSKLLIVDNPHY